MSRSVVAILITILALIAFSQVAYAKDVTEGGKYTAFGAEKAGNETGEIPAFEGKANLKCPEGYKKGDFLPNPFGEDKVLFKIDHTNVDKYIDRLTPGQVARLKKNTFYYMNIYPTHRIMEYDKKYLEATAKNYETTYTDEKNVLQNYNGGLPFPHPKNGVEGIWNVKKVSAADDIAVVHCTRHVSPKGKVRKQIWQTYVMFRDHRLNNPMPNPNGVAFCNRTIYLYPADKEGSAFLSHYYIDDNKKEDLWQYIPSLRRVRRAPTMDGGYQSEGESTIDEVGYGYRAAVNSFTWSLIGKKETYIPANPYDLWREGAEDEEVIAGDMSPVTVRYELHRCWIVEGTRTPDISHPYSKRVLYLNEDNWSGTVTDNYDTRGGLWRFSEYHQIFDYCNGYKVWHGDIYLNLESGKFEMHGGCRGDGYKYQPQTPNVGLDESMFTVQALRSFGR